MSHGQVRVQHDCVGREALTVGGDDRSRHVADGFHRFHGDPVVDGHPVLHGGIGHGLRECMHPTAGEVDAGDGVHVGDHRVQGQRLVGGEPGVHGLEGEEPAGARVLEERVHLALEATESAEGHQAGQIRGEQVEGAVEVSVDELTDLELVHLPDVVHEP